MSVTYVPVYTGLVERELEGMHLQWWKPDAVIKHSTLLITAASGINEWNFREKHKIPTDGFTLIGDSGGFQLLTGQVPFLEPINVLRWLEKNADIGMTLDVPPVDPVTLGPLDDMNYFRKCAEKSARYYEKMYADRVTTHLQLLKVSQGGNKKELELWHKITNDCKFDGFSLSCKPPGDPMQVALHTTFIHGKEQPKRIHILLGTGYDVIPAIIYASKMFEDVTFDSASYLQGAKMRTYSLPINPKIRIDFSTKEGNNLKLKKLPCSCPICQNLKPSDLQGEGSTIGAALSIHNLWVVKNYIETLTTMVDDEELFLTFVRRNCGSRTLKSIEMIDDYIEKGDFNEVYEKYLPYFRSVTRKQGIL